jgi:hypothetical protein
VGKELFVFRTEMSQYYTDAISNIFLTPMRVNVIHFSSILPQTSCCILLCLGKLLRKVQVLGTDCKEYVVLGKCVILKSK